MSDSHMTKELLKEYIIARIPFISVNSIERERVFEMIKEIILDLDIPFFAYSSSKGIYDIATNHIQSSDKSLYGTLNTISEKMVSQKYQGIVFSDVSDLNHETDVAHQFLDLISLANESGGIVIVITHSPVWPLLQRKGMHLVLDTPNEDEMYVIIKNLINNYSSQIDCKWTEKEIRDASLYLSGATQMEAENVISSLAAKKSINPEDLEYVKNCKNNIFTNISGLERIDFEREFLSAGGLSSLRNWLNLKKELFLTENRIKLKKMGIQPPRGVLLVGVPGCGKSLTAKIIAKNWNFPLYRLDLATVQGKYVGQSEQQLHDALKMAESVSPCILWIDEIEKGLSGHSISNDGGVTTRMVGQLLFWMQECKKQVFVVATANNISILPPELLRKGRFDEIFFLDLPNREERLEILKLYMARYLNLDFVGDFSEKILDLTEGFSGADIEVAVREIAYMKLADEKFSLSQGNIIKIFNAVIPISKTIPDKINEIRDWGKTHAISASIINP